MSWRFDKVRAGSGALGDVGSHCIDLLQYLVGPISKSRRPGWQTFIPQRRDRDGTVVDVTVDDQTEILADFESGASGTILASWAGTGHKCDLGFEVDRLAAARCAFTLAAVERAAVLRRTEPQDRQGYPHDLRRARRIPAPTASTPLPRRASATPMRSPSRRATRCATSPAGKVLSGPSFVDGLRVAEVTDAVIAAVASGSSATVVRRTI